MGMGIQGIMADKQRAIQEQADRMERWLYASHEQLAQLVGITEQSMAHDEFARFPVKLTTNAAGVAEWTIQAIQGWHYQLINAAVTSQTGEDGVLLVYLNGYHPADLLHVIALGQYTSDAFPDGTYVPQGVNLYLRIESGNVSQDIYVNILAKKLATQNPLVTTAGGED